MNFPTHFLAFMLIAPVVSQQPSFNASTSSAHPGDSVVFTCTDSNADNTLIRTFSRNQGATQCTVDMTANPCSPSYPSGRACGCVQTSGAVKTITFTKTVSLGDTGSWTCEVNVNPTNVIRSEGFTLTVAVATTTQTPGVSNQSTTVSSSVFLVKDVCPRNLTQGQHLYISYRQQQDFPPTGGVAINFVHNGNNENPFRVFNWKECPKENSDYGCSNTSGPIIFYINVTANCSQAGTWTATYDRTPSDHIRSEICQVEGCDRQVEETCKGLVGTLGACAIVLTVVLIVQIVFYACFREKPPKDTRWKYACIATVVLGVVVLIFLIATGAYCLGTNRDIIVIAGLFSVTVGFVAYGSVDVAIAFVASLVIYCLSSGGEKNK